MSSQTIVRRRHVFYIPGYDPIHPRRYRELYRTESAAQAAVSGYRIDVMQQHTAGGFGWHVVADIDGTRTETNFETLVWSDIVRDSMDQGITATYTKLLRTAWIYISSGTLFRLMRLRKGPVIAALYPVAFLILQLILAVAVASVLNWGGKALLVPLIGGFGHLIALAVGVGVALWLLNWFKRQDNRFFAYYLMHDYAHSAQHKGAYGQALEARLDIFTKAVTEALSRDVDEVLVVGHSSGAHLGVSVLSDLLRAGGFVNQRPALSFLSLGQVVPMVSFLPNAHRLRADLQFLSTQSDVTWLDVSAPGDGCAFALCDPVSVTGVAPPEKRWPLVISAAFTQTLSPARWKELRWRFFRLHFQYLCAFDRPGDYDYFQITAGPRLLADRIEGRAPSKSRIERPTSGYTSVQA